MNTHSSTDSNLSIDSLENEFKRKLSKKSGVSDENVDTILVPFYDQDVLIKVPKDKKKQKYESKNIKYNEKQKEDKNLQNSYLVNKDKKNFRRTSYLEMFRKQFHLQSKETKIENYEIRSLSPEVGDTERESINESPTNLATEFFNTEPYNEIYYEKLVQGNYEQYLDNSLEELRDAGDTNCKSPSELVDNSLRSVSEVTQPRRPLRRTIAEPIQNIKLGGLGPDVEKIKPNLERARSLQRYSEKVRMENRVKIYKKSLLTDHEMKKEKEPSSRRRNLAKDLNMEKEKGQNSTYLMNKVNDDKPPKLISAINCYKSKSANVQKIKERALEKVQHLRSASKKHEAPISKQNNKNNIDSEKKTDRANYQDNKKTSAKSSGRNNNSMSKEHTTSRQETPPVHISFMVNVSGARPSTALKKLEEKHRMYQEQIRSFNKDPNNK